MTFRESDDRIVPQKLEDQSSGKKPGNTDVGKAARTSRDPDRASSVLRDGTSVLTRLDRISQRAQAHPEAVFTNLFSLLTEELLWEAWFGLKGGKAPGVDGVTLEDYEANLRDNLQDLLRRLHRGSYRPKPSLRKLIPKGNGKTRPLGIASLEDKLVQRAIVLILERIYEVDFYETSYGYRPGKSCHEALADLGEIIATRRVNLVSDADIKGFFDNVSHDAIGRAAADPHWRSEAASPDRPVPQSGCDDRRSTGGHRGRRAARGKSVPFARERVLALCAGPVVRASKSNRGCEANVT